MEVTLAVSNDDIACSTKNMMSRRNHNVHNGHFTLSDYTIPVKYRFFLSATIDLASPCIMLVMSLCYSFWLVHVVWVTNYVLPEMTLLEVGVVTADIFGVQNVKSWSICKTHDMVI